MQTHLHAESNPSLPAGNPAQPVWGFQDELARYRFNHVYREVLPGDAATRRDVLDEDLCFWKVTSVAAPGDDELKPKVRCLSYAEARQSGRPALTFARFSSLQQMRAELGAMMAPGMNMNA